MKNKIFTFFLFFITGTTGFGQIKVHSHNDYTHDLPLFNAIENRAFSIEVDVFAVGDSLFVAHSRNEIKAGNTIQELYLKPIETFYNSSKFYSFQLMIDVKDRWELIYPILIKTLKPYEKTYLARSKKVTVAISGTRPPHSTFHSYPSFINFDGLPNVVYAPEDLKKITMISDNFANHSTWNGLGKISETEKQNLEKLVKDAHSIGKPFRFWGAPDTEVCWRFLQEIGADIINTDKVSAATNFIKVQTIVK